MLEKEPDTNPRSLQPSEEKSSTKKREEQQQRIAQEAYLGCPGNLQGKCFEETVVNCVRQG